MAELKTLYLSDEEYEFLLSEIETYRGRFAAAEARAEAGRLACEAAIRYDEAIRQCANSPELMASFCTAEGDDLDALYFDWLEKARAVLADNEGE